MKCLRITDRSKVWILLNLRILLSGEDTFEEDLSESPNLGRGKQGFKIDVMNDDDGGRETTNVYLLF